MLAVRRQCRHFICCLAYRMLIIGMGAARATASIITPATAAAFRMIGGKRFRYCVAAARWVSHYAGCFRANMEIAASPFRKAPLRLLRAGGDAAAAILVSFLALPHYRAGAALMTLFRLSMMISREIIIEELMPPIGHGRRFRALACFFLKVLFPLFLYFHVIFTSKIHDAGP